MMSPTNVSGHTTIPPNTSSHEVPSYCSTNQGPVNFHAFNSESYPRLRSSFYWFWSPLFHDVALVARCIWTLIIAFLVLIAYASDLNRAYLEGVSFFSFASNCFRHFHMQARQVPWLVSCLTIATDVWSNTESFIVPVAIWSCTMRGFWNSWRFLRVIFWQVCMALLPIHVAHVLNLTALVATVAFDYENGGVNALIVTLRHLWRFDGPSVFVCTPLVLIKFAVALIYLGLNTILFKPAKHFAFDIASHRFVMLVKLYVWKVSVLWILTLESVESFACTPLVMAKLIWLLVIALLRISISTFFVWFQNTTHTFRTSASLIGNTFRTSVSLIGTFVTCVGGWTEWLLVFTMLLLEENVWMFVFKTCFVWGSWTWFRRTLWKPRSTKLARSLTNTPCFVENNRLLLAEAKEAVKHAENVAKEVSATIDQHLNAAWWSRSGRSMRCIFIFIVALSLSWVSSWYSSLPWNRHISTATEIYNIVSNFKCSEFHQFIQSKNQQKQYIESIQQYAKSNLQQIKQSMKIGGSGRGRGRPRGSSSRATGSPPRPVRSSARSGAGDHPARAREIKLEESAKVNANRHHSDHTAEANIDKCAAFRAEELRLRAETIAALPKKLTSPDPPNAADMREAHANVMSAQLKFWERTGLHLFQEEMDQVATMDPTNMSADDQVYVKEFADKLRTNKLTPADAYRIVMEWEGLDPSTGKPTNEGFSLQRNVYSCGVCGVRDIMPSNPYTCHAVTPSGIMEHLLLDEEQIQALEYYGEYQALVSVWPSPEVLDQHPELAESKWFLHPELVIEKKTDKGESEFCTWTCASCAKSLQSGKVPERSTAGRAKARDLSDQPTWDRLDFGNSERYKKLGLEPLTLAEKMLVARVRLYGSVIQLHAPPAHDELKLTARKIRGHIISFFQNGPQQVQHKIDELRAASRQFPNPAGLKQFIKVVFLGKRESMHDLQIGRLLRSEGNELYCDWNKVLRWLRMLKTVNPEYADIEIDDSPGCQARVDAELDSLVSPENLFPVDNEAHLRHHQKLMDNIAGVRSSDDGTYDDISFPEVAMPRFDTSSCDTRECADADADAPTCSIGNLSNCFLGNYEQSASQSPPHQFISAMKKALFPNNPLAEEAAAVAAAAAWAGAAGAAAGAACRDLPTGSKPGSEVLPGRIAVSRRDDSPLSEFNDNDLLFALAMPWCFPFGRSGIPSNTAFNLTFRRHTLRQSSCMFAHEPWYYFLLANQMQRQAVLHNSNKFRTDPAAMETLQILVNRPEAAAEFDRARQNPESQEAKDLHSKLSPLIKQGAGNIPFSSMASSHGVAKMYSMAHVFGTPSVFFTFAMDDVHNALVIRLSYPGNNDEKTFPCSPEQLNEALRQGGAGLGIEQEVKIDLTELGLSNSVVSNPVACAQVFTLLMHHVFHTLLGIDSANVSGDHDASRGGDHTADNTFLCTRKKGIFGTTTAVFATVEVQARLTLHAHLAVWTTMSPELLQKCSAFPELRAACTEVLDSYFQGTARPIDMLAHLTRLVVPDAADQFELKNPQYHDASGSMPFCPPNCENEALEMGDEEFDPTLVKKHCCHHNPTSFQRRVSDVMMFRQIHSHGFTCRKYNVGKKQCRMCYPKDLIPETTCVQLHLRRNDQPDMVDDGKGAAAAVESAPDEAKKDHKAPLPPQRFVVSAPEPFFITPHTRPLVKPKDNEGLISDEREPYVRPRHPIGPTDDRILVWEMRRPVLTEIMLFPIHRNLPHDHHQNIRHTF